MYNCIVRACVSITFAHWNIEYRKWKRFFFFIFAFYKNFFLIIKYTIKLLYILYRNKYKHKKKYITLGLLLASTKCILSVLWNETVDLKMILLNSQYCKWTNWMKLSYWISAFFICVKNETKKREREWNGKVEWTFRA